MAVVIDPPEQPPRVYERQWKAVVWRGSLDEILAAATVALTEIRRQVPDGDDVFEYISIDFTDKSNQQYETFDNLRAAAPNLNIAEVQDVWIGFRADSSSVRIHGQKDQGLSVDAEGSESFASGIVATLKSRFAGGAEAGERAASIPFRPVDWAAITFVTLLIAGLFFVALHWSGGDAVGAVILASSIAWIPAGGLWWVLDKSREKLKQPPFQLVGEGKQFPDEGEKRTGPVWAAKEWFDNHPALKFISVLIVGVALGRAAELIRF